MNPGPAPRSSFRDLTGIFVVMLLSLAAYGWIAVGGKTVTGFSDSIDYLILADFYRTAFFGIADPAAIDFYRTTRFPPLFPMFLAAFGGGSVGQHVSTVLSSATAVAAIIMTWYWSRRVLGSGALASLVAATLAFNPGFFMLNMTPVSEPLALVMTLVALTLAAQARPLASALLVVALVVGVSTLVRSANVALVVAVVAWAYFASGRSMRSASWVTFIAAAPMLAWSVYRAQLPGAHHYATALDVDFMVAKLGGWPEVLVVQPYRFVLAIAQTWSVHPGWFDTLLATIFSLLAFAGTVMRLRGNHLDAWLSVIYIGMILVWPYPEELWRFVIFVLPLLVVAAICAVAAIVRRSRIGKANDVRIAALAVFALTIMASGSIIVEFVRRMQVEVPEELVGEQREQVFFRAGTVHDAVLSVEYSGRLRMLIEEAAAIVPVDGCVYSVMPQLVWLHARRASIAYPTSLSPDRAIREQLSVCDFMLVSSFGFSGVSVSTFYPSEFLGDQVEPVLITYADDSEEKPVAVLLTWKATAMPPGKS